MLAVFGSTFSLQPHFLLQNTSQLRQKTLLFGNSKISPYLKWIHIDHPDFNSDDTICQKNLQALPHPIDQSKHHRSDLHAIILENTGLCQTYEGAYTHSPTMPSHTIATLPRISREKLADLVRAKSPTLAVIDVRDSDYVNPPPLPLLRQVLLTHRTRSAATSSTARTSQPQLWTTNSPSSCAPSAIRTSWSSTARSRSSGDPGRR